MSLVCVDLIKLRRIFNWSFNPEFSVRLTVFIISIMVVGIPKVVESVLDIVLESEVFQDYRIIGNGKGTTLVLRYASIQDTIDNQRRSPEWKYRSRVNMTRDNIRLNAWIKDNSTGVVENNCQGLESMRGNIWGNDRSPSNAFVHEWNVNAPDFQSRMVSGMSVIEKKDIEVQTDVCSDSDQKSARSNTATVDCQTDPPALLVNSGTQYYLEKRSVGISCKISPVVKSKFVQATVGSKSVGVLASVITQHASTQSGNGEIQVSKCDVGVSCTQAPGSRGRHTQTDKLIRVGAWTNTEKTMVSSVATETEQNSGTTVNIDSSTKTDMANNTHQTGGKGRSDLASRLLKNLYGQSVYEELTSTSGGFEKSDENYDGAYGGETRTYGGHDNSGGGYCDGYGGRTSGYGRHGNSGGGYGGGYGGRRDWKYKK
jgi:hypothetical protein